MSIQNRTVFYDYTNGIARFWDWALITTTLGTMVEPFQLGKHQLDTPSIEFDPTDEIVKINEIRAADVDKSLLILSGGVTQLNGGTMIPRNGR